MALPFMDEFAAAQNAPAAPKPKLPLWDEFEQEQASTRPKAIPLSASAPPAPDVTPEGRKQAALGLRIASTATGTGKFAGEQYDSVPPVAAGIVGLGQGAAAALPFQPIVWGALREADFVSPEMENYLPKGVAPVETNPTANGFVKAAPSVARAIGEAYLGGKAGIPGLTVAGGLNQFGEIIHEQSLKSDQGPRVSDALSEMETSPWQAARVPVGAAINAGAGMVANKLAQSGNQALRGASSQAATELLANRTPEGVQAASQAISGEARKQVVREALGNAAYAGGTAPAQAYVSMKGQGLDPNTPEGRQALLTSTLAGVGMTAVPGLASMRGAPLRYKNAIEQGVMDAGSKYAADRFAARAIPTPEGYVPPQDQTVTPMAPAGLGYGQTRALPGAMPTAPFSTVAPEARTAKGALPDAPDLAQGQNVSPTPEVEGQWVETPEGMRFVDRPRSTSYTTPEMQAWQATQEMRANAMSAPARALPEPQKKIPDLRQRFQMPSPPDDGGTPPPPVETPPVSGNGRKPLAALDASPQEAPVAPRSPFVGDPRAVMPQTPASPIVGDPRAVPARVENPILGDPRQASVEGMRQGFKSDPPAPIVEQVPGRAENANAPTASKKSRFAKRDAQMPQEPTPQFVADTLKALETQDEVYVSPQVNVGGKLINTGFALKQAGLEMGSNLNRWRKVAPKGQQNATQAAQAVNQGANGSLQGRVEGVPEANAAGAGGDAQAQPEVRSLSDNELDAAINEERSQRKIRLEQQLSVNKAEISKESKRLRRFKEGTGGQASQKARIEELRRANDAIVAEINDGSWRERSPYVKEFNRRIEEKRAVGPKTYKVEYQRSGSQPSAPLNRGGESVLLKEQEAGREQPPQPTQDIPSKLRAAYPTLKADGFSDVPIADLAKAAGVTPDEARAALTEMQRSGEATMSRGDESVMTPEQREAGVDVLGTRQYQVRMGEKAAEKQGGAAKQPWEMTREEYALRDLIIEYVDDDHPDLKRIGGAGMHRKGENRILVKKNQPKALPNWVRNHETGHYLYDDLQGVTVASIMSENPELWRQAQSMSSVKSHWKGYKDPSGVDWVEALADMRAELAERPNLDVPEVKKFLAREARGAKEHEQMVKDAVSNDQPVPRNVLEEYRDEPWAQAALAKPDHPAKGEGVAAEGKAKSKLNKWEPFARSGDYEFALIDSTVAERPDMVAVGIRRIGSSEPFESGGYGNNISKERMLARWAEKEMARGDKMETLHPMAETAWGEQKRVVDEANAAKQAEAKAKADADKAAADRVAAYESVTRSTPLPKGTRVEQKDVFGVTHNATNYGGYVLYKVDGKYEKFPYRVAHVDSGGKTLGKGFETIESAKRFIASAINAGVNVKDAAAGVKAEADKLVGIYRYEKEGGEPPALEKPVVQDQPKPKRRFGAKREAEAPDFKKMVLNALKDGPKTYRELIDLAGDPTKTRFSTKNINREKVGEIVRELYTLNKIDKVDYGDGETRYEAKAEAKAASTDDEPTLEDKANAARERINQRNEKRTKRGRFNKLSSNPIGGLAQEVRDSLEDVRDYAIIGAAKLAKGVKGFKDWAREMADEIRGLDGATLSKIYQQSRRIHEWQNGRRWEVAKETMESLRLTPKDAVQDIVNGVVYSKTKGLPVKSGLPVKADAALRDFAAMEDNRGGAGRTFKLMQQNADSLLKEMSDDFEMGGPLHDIAYKEIARADSERMGEVQKAHDFMMSLLPDAKTARKWSFRASGDAAEPVRLRLSSGNVEFYPAEIIDLVGHLGDKATRKLILGAYGRAQEMIERLRLNIDKAQKRMTAEPSINKKVREQNKVKVWTRRLTALERALPGLSERPGAPLNFERHKSGPPVHLRIADVQAIEDASRRMGLAPVAQGMKQYIENEVTPKAFAARTEWPKQINAFYKNLGVPRDYSARALEKTPGYWPRRRGYQEKLVDESSVDSIFEGNVAYLSHPSFTKERKENRRSPILIRDGFETFMDHVEDAAKLIHLAAPVRMADHVLRLPEVRRAVVQQYGLETFDTLAAYLKDMAMVNRAPATRGEKAMRFFRANAARAVLHLNPSPVLKQFGGDIRLGTMIPAKYLQASWGEAMNSETRDEMVRLSPVLRDRYDEQRLSKYVPFLGKLGSLVGEPTTAELVDHISRAAQSGHLLQASSTLGQLIDKERTLEKGDEMVARHAWAALKAWVNDDHPDWSEADKMQWVRWMAEEVVGRTQNSSRNIDRSFSELRSQKNPFYLFTMFKSDANKAANLLYQDMHRDGRTKARTAAVLAADRAWSSLVSMALRYLPIAAGAAFGGKELAGVLEERKKKAKSGPLTDLLWNFVKDALGMVYGGDIAAEFFESAVKQRPPDATRAQNIVFRNAWDSLTGLYGIVHAVTKDYDDPRPNEKTMAENLLGAATKLGTGAAGLAGIPVSPLGYMAGRFNTGYGYEEKGAKASGGGFGGVKFGSSGSGKNGFGKSSFGKSKFGGR